MIAVFVANGQEALRKAVMGMLEMKLSCFVWTFRRNLFNKLMSQKIMKKKGHVKIARKRASQAGVMNCLVFRTNLIFLLRL